MLNLPQIAEVFKELPDYSDYNCSKTNNYSLQTAKRHSSLGGIFQFGNISVVRAFLCPSVGGCIFPLFKSATMQ